MYVTYDKYDVEVLKKQSSACYHYGVIGERIPQHILDARLKCVKNIGAMEQTQVIFADLGKHRNMHKQLAERIAQERKWLVHYDACIAEYKKGREKRAKSTQGFSLTFLASTMVAEEAARDAKPPLPKEKPKAEERPPNKTEEAKTMLAKQIGPDVKPPKVEQRKPKFWQVDNGKKQGKVDGKEEVAAA